MTKDQNKKSYKIRPAPEVTSFEHITGDLEEKWMKGITPTRILSIEKIKQLFTHNDGIFTPTNHD